MVSPLSNSTATSVKWGQSAKTQKAGKRTAESAMTDGFIERIKEYAKEDAKQGVYMSKGFTQFHLAHMKQCVSPDLLPMFFVVNIGILFLWLSSFRLV